MMKWTFKLEKARNSAKGNHLPPLFDKFAADCPSYHLIVNFLSKEKFEC